MPDGSTLVHDVLAHRFVVVGADGLPSGEIIAAPAPREGAQEIELYSRVRGVDRRGRIYLEATRYGTGGDSLTIVRWDPAGGGAPETVATLPGASGADVRRESGTSVFRRRAAGKAYAPQEAWGVDADGRIARLVPSPYQLHWLTDGREDAGPVVPHTPIPVTEADRQAVLESRRRASAAPSRFGDGDGAALPARGSPRVEFEDVKPPFDARAVLVAPEGEVWALRYRAAADSVPVYDVFNRHGALTHQVVLRPGSRVVGFGRASVYVARMDENDLEYLLRYRR